MSVFCKCKRLSLIKTNLLIDLLIAYGKLCVCWEGHFPTYSPCIGLKVASTCYIGPRILCKLFPDVKSTANENFTDQCYLYDIWKMMHNGCVSFYNKYWFHTLSVIFGKTILIKINWILLVFWFFFFFLRCSNTVEKYKLWQFCAVVYMYVCCMFIARRPKSTLNSRTS